MQRLKAANPPDAVLKVGGHTCIDSADVLWPRLVTCMQGALQHDLAMAPFAVHAVCELCHAPPAERHVCQSLAYLVLTRWQQAQQAQSLSQQWQLLQVAQREYRRLKKSNEQQPGYAMSRAYLETLADLPWSTFSDSRQKHSQPALRMRSSSSATADHAGASFSVVMSFNFTASMSIMSAGNELKPHDQLVERCSV